MTRTDLRMLFEIPDYWTPEQALAVYELLDALRERILCHYQGESKTRSAKSGHPPRRQSAAVVPNRMPTDRNRLSTITAKAR